MKQYIKIDKDGYLIEDVIVEPIIIPEEYAEDMVTVIAESREEYPEMDEFHIETLLPDEPFVRPRWDGVKWVDDPTEEQHEEIILNRKTARFTRLSNIFNDKATGLKKLAVNKPWMSDPEAINNQDRVYEEMYENAKAGRYDTATNTAIITANETVKAQLADLTLLLNSIRSVIEVAIANDDASADTLLSQADGISLSMADLTPTKIGETKTMFGL